MQCRHWVCLACGTAAACLSERDPVALRPYVAEPPISAPATRWLLAYAGNSEVFPYRTIHFQRLIAQMDTLGQPRSWLFGGAIMLAMYAPSGRVFTTWVGGQPANGADWSEYLDSLFVPGAVLSRLDSAISVLSGPLGSPPEPFRVSVMIPYPDPGIDTLTFGGRRYDFTSIEGRSEAATAFIDDVVNRFRAAGLPQLQLDGFYWLLEEAPSADSAVIARVATVVHSDGLRLLWIPYYAAENWDHWQQLGFDAAWLQPNYFFDPTIPDSRLDSAAIMAMGHGMGMEVEFDSRLVLDQTFSNRLTPYLTTLAAHPVLTAREMAVYEGVGGLIRLERFHQPAFEALYQQLVDVLH